MKPILTKTLKILFSDLRQSIISSIVVATLISVGGIYLLVKNVRIYLQVAMQSPTPLWATISLILLCFLYVYLKTRSHNPPDVIVSKTHLSSDALQILIFFGKKDDIYLTTNELSTEFNLTFNQTQFAIDELLHFDFLYTETPWGEDQIYWLSTKGRVLLGKEKLL